MPYGYLNPIWSKMGIKANITLNCNHWFTYLPHRQRLCLPWHAQNLARCLPVIRADIINVAGLIKTIIMTNMDCGLWANASTPFTCLSPKMLLLCALGGCDGLFRWVKSLSQSRLTAYRQRLWVQAPSTQHCCEPTPGQEGFGEGVSSLQQGRTQAQGPGSGGLRPSPVCYGEATVSPHSSCPLNGIIRVNAK